MKIPCMRQITLSIWPRRGEHGGKIIAQGNVEEIKQNPNSITGRYLSGAVRIEVPQKRRDYNGKVIRILGAKENNLKDIDVISLSASLPV